MSRKIKKVISVLVIATLFVMSFAGISLSYVSAAADEIGRASCRERV